MLSFAGEDGTSVVLDPEHGGAIHQICLVPEGRDTPVDILAPGTPGVPEPEFRGCFLFPFNDRIPGGVYTFGGRRHSLPINDPEFGDAIHGFAYRTPAHVSAAILPETSGVEADNSGTTPADGAAPRGGVEAHIGVDVADQPGYPFQVRLAVDITVSGPRAELRFTVTNTGDGDAPIALGWHPYFILGSSAVREPMLQIPARSFVPVDDRLLPLGGTAATAGTNYDFTLPRPIGSADLDIAYTDLFGPVKLLGTRYTLVVQPGQSLFRYLQIYTPPDHTSVAIEPITAATDSFNTPDLGLRVLSPGDRSAGTVSISIHEGRGG